MRMAVIGCGAIGQKRARALSGHQLAVCCDSVLERAIALASSIPGAVASSDWREAVARPDVDLVIVATTHDMLAPVAEAACSAGKHVLIEKPGARSAAEMEPVAEAARKSGVLVRIGFNHRYHRAFRQALKIVASREIGPMMYIRARYGHGGRTGYEQEWRAQPDLSGGGEAIDQGVHLIDLARLFLGDFSQVQGVAETFFWDMPVEDNAFFLLRTPEGQVAQLHASWSEWRNLFSFEIFARDAKLEITGLGGSYGLERLAYYKMDPEKMGPPETFIWEYPMADDSWEAELADFVEDIRRGRVPRPTISDAQAALRIVEQVCRESGGLRRAVGMEART